MCDSRVPDIPPHSIPRVLTTLYHVAVLCCGGIPWYHQTTYSGAVSLWRCVLVGTACRVYGYPHTIGRRSYVIPRMVGRCVIAGYLISHLTPSHVYSPRCTT